MPRFIAVLPAGGSSRRAAQNKLVQLYRSKLLVPIEGTPVLLKTLAVFAASHAFEYIVLSLAADLRDDFSKLLAEPLHGNLEVRQVLGGETRQQSVFNALKLIKAAEADTSDLYVVVHDAARCFLSTELVRLTLDQVLLHQAVSAAVEVSDTIVEVGPENQLLCNHPRERLRAVQTPQAFKFDLLYQAHLSAGADATDDSTLVAKTGQAIYYFQGEHSNRKLTFAEDF